MTNTPSQKVQKRQTAAQRVQAALAAQAKAMTAGVDAAMKAYADREAARRAEDEADDRLRAAVDQLVQTGQPLESIAALTDVPLSDVRAARRPKRDDDEDEQPDTGSGSSTPSGAGEGKRQRRQLAVETPETPPAVPPFLGDGESGDGQSEGQAGGGEQPSGEAAA